LDADVAVAQMAAAHLVGPWTMHIPIALMSMMNHWWKKFKALDLHVILPFDSDLWHESSEFEPLTLAFAFPHLRVAPW
jgi:hypothetical protein